MRMRRFFKIFLRPVFALVLASLLCPQLVSQSHAQSSPDSSKTAGIDTRDALGTILMSGLVGGILGLSTLSFYSHPEKHIRNITWGVGIGMISAAVYITYDAAQSASMGPPRTSFYVFPSDDFKVANLGLQRRF